MEDLRELIPMQTACAIRGVGKSTYFTLIKKRQIPRPIKAGPNNRRQVRGEMYRVRDAVIAERTEAEIERLVVEIEAARKTT